MKMKRERPGSRKGASLQGSTGVFHHFTSLIEDRVTLKRESGREENGGGKIGRSGSWEKLG